MTRITDEMREAGVAAFQDGSDGFDGADSAAIYLAMFALDPEVVEMRAEIAAQRALIKDCANQFEFYQVSHLAKTPPDTEKALTNRCFADRCRAILDATP